MDDSSKETAKELITWTEILDISDGVPRNFDVKDSKPIYVENKIIEGDFLYSGGTVARQFQIKNCTVKGEFQCTYITFSEIFSIEKTVFEKSFDIHGCTFSTDFSAWEMQSTDANFESTRINGQLTAQKAVFKGSANFVNISIAGSAYFNESEFEKKPDFVLSVFGRFTSFEGANFKEGASFISSIFQGHLFLSNQLVSGEDLDFTWAFISGLLSISDSTFKKNLTLKQVSIGGIFLAENVEFGKESTLILEDSQLRSEITIVNCSFKKDTDTCINVANAELLGGFKMKDCHEINGEVSFYNSNIHKHFKIGTYADKDKTEESRLIFNKMVNFSSLRVNGMFQCAHADFKISSDFSDMVINGNTYIYSCEFLQEIKFNRSEFLGIFGTNSIFGAPVYFEGTKFRKAIRFLDGCYFKNTAEFYFAQFDDEANFGGARIGKNLSLRNARFHHSLSFESMDMLINGSVSNGKWLDLNGCIYGTLLLPQNFKTLDAFMEALPDSDRSTWVFLEAYLRKTGRIEYANKVRVHWNLHEGNKLRFFSLGWIRDRSFRYLTNYGTAIWIIVLIVFVLILTNDLITIIWEKEPWRTLIHTALKGLALAGGGLATEALRRRTWPE